MTKPTADVRLARSSGYNLLGQGLPLVAALVAIPLLVDGLGTARFGVLTLAWVLIGYFSVFDFGLGRALTQVVGRHLGEGHRTSPAVAWTALLVMFALGLAAMTILWLTAPWLVALALRTAPELRSETLTAVRVLAAGVPVVVLTTGLAGILAAFQRFGTLNAVRAPMGVLAFLAPVAVLPFSATLPAVVAVLVAVRVAACVAHAAVCTSLLPPLNRKVLSLGAVRPLFRLGAWMTVSNLVSPIMLYLDRFVIATMLSLTAVTYYATPYEMVTRLLIVTGAISAVLFPSFAARYESDQEGLTRLFFRGAKYVTLIMFPIILLTVGLAREGLDLWLGPEFATESTVVLQVLALGVFVNSLGQVFYALAQGVGRPDVTALFHLVQAPLYVGVLWWSVVNWGIVGAAAAWTGRVVVDGLMLYGFSRRLVVADRGAFRRLSAGVLASVVALSVPLVLPSLQLRLAAVALLMGAFTLTAWLLVLNVEERASIRRRVGLVEGV